MFAKVLKEYGLSFDDGLKLTPRRFWFLLNQIERLRAEERVAHMHMLAAMGTKESFEKALDNLTDQIGQVYVWEVKAPAQIRVDPVTGLDPEFDREALRALKARIAAGG